MKISGLGASFPSIHFTNEDAIHKLEKDSKDKFNYNLGSNFDDLLCKLNSTGIKNRYWLRENESHIDIVSDAVQKALNDASLSKNDIDLLIYSSVFRQFIEPGESFFIAKALGFKNIECFDVLEACNSFVRASNISKSYLNSGQYKNILVITSEFMPHQNNYKPSFEMKDYSNVNYLFSSLTTGEGASATIFTDDHKTWEQEIIAKPQHANFCYLPISNIHDQELDLYGLNSEDVSDYKFVSYSLKLHKEGYHTLKDMILKYIDRKGIDDIVLPHSHSLNVWNRFNKELKEIIPYYHIFPNYGNLVTGSFPTALYLAKKEGKLKREMKVGAWMAAAGMSLSITNFEF